MRYKEELLEKLIKRNIFWSYDTESIRSCIRDSILIEHTLLYSDVEDIYRLFLIFDEKKIKRVWEEEILLDKRFIKLNHYLARFFFDVENIEDYIEKHKKNSRYERIKRACLRD